MNILRAEHLGMCFGVRDAISLATSKAADGPVTVLGDLVHNERVLSRLTDLGIRFANDPAEVRTPTVLITAHGASEKRLQAVRETGRDVLETTCPLVHVAHAALRKLVGEGFHPVIIGLRNHVEVRGMTDDLADHDVVLSEDDVATLQERARFGIVSQTTQPIERVRHLVACIRRRFPNSEIRFRDTVCQPTKLRQHAAEALAKSCDIVVVIGGAHSNNTRELVATCRRNCSRVHHVQNASDLQPAWFLSGDTVGVTAGTSTPDDLINEVEQKLHELAARHLSVSEAFSR